MNDMTIAKFLRSSARLASVCFLVASFLTVSGEASRALAAEMIMFESSSCTWCEAWQNDVGIVYDKTSEAKVLPLRRVDIDDPRPSDLEHIGGIVYTPTFVVLENGKEIGRIIGYPGEDFFWQLLDEIAKKVEKKQAGNL